MLFRSGENIPKPGIPEGFKVLVKELQALGLDIELYNDKGTEIELKEDIEDAVDFNAIQDDAKPEEKMVTDARSLSKSYIEELAGGDDIEDVEDENDDYEDDDYEDTLSDEMDRKIEEEENFEGLEEEDEFDDEFDDLD